MRFTIATPREAIVISTFVQEENYGKANHIERGPSTKLSVELDDTLCERLWKLEREWWRGKREPVVESWRSLIEDIFDSYLTSRGY